MLDQEQMKSRIDHETAHETFMRLSEDLAWHADPDNASTYSNKDEWRGAIHRDIIGLAVRDAVREGLPLSRVIRAALNHQRLQGGFIGIDGDDQHITVSRMISACDSIEFVNDDRNVEVVRSVLNIMEHRRLLERSHWNVISAMAMPRDMEGRRGPPHAWNVRRAHWHYLSSIMLSTIGTMLENIPETMGIALSGTERQASPLARLRSECRSAMSCFSVIAIHPLWHPDAPAETIDPDNEGVRCRWKALCDLVASIAGVEPAYGVPYVHQEEMPRVSTKFRDRLASLPQRLFRRSVPDAVVEELWAEAADAGYAAGGVPQYRHRFI